MTCFLSGFSLPITKLNKEIKDYQFGSLQNTAFNFQPSNVIETICTTVWFAKFTLFPKSTSSSLMVVPFQEPVINSLVMFKIEIISLKDVLTNVIHV